MHQNPFYPSFSLRPELFYGRDDYLGEFKRALENAQSPDVNLILTGTRGCGKTSLLHQYALQAKRYGLETLETTGTDALAQLANLTNPLKRTSTSAVLNPTLAVEGVGSASLLEYNRTVTRSASDADETKLLSMRLCEMLSGRKYRHGLLMIVDEVQKIDEDDIVLIGNAFQSAITQGLSAHLVLGGLPNAYHRIRNFKRCTFLRRMRRVKLWCMGIDETVDFVSAMFAKVPEMGLTKTQLFSLAEFTGGHPYLVQLLGHRLYQLVERYLDPLPQSVVPVPQEVIAEAEEGALAQYKHNVLDDVVSTSRKDTRDYLRAAYAARRADGLIAVRDVNAQFPGKTASQLNSMRSYALNTQVLQFERYGYISFALPHYEYIFKHLAYEEQPTPRSQRWRY